jgi:sigma-B regulation protein RsbU (phosphoserine phosphatase)
MTWLGCEDSTAVLQAGPHDGTSNKVANTLLSPNTRPDLASLRQQLAIAREVQRASLPAQTPRIPGLDSAIFYKPAHSIGGDYYDFLCLQNGEWGIAIGDVAGKGIAAALVMANLQGFLRAQTFQHAPDLPTLISNINRLVWQSSPQHFFASLFYGEYDPQSRCLQYVNAGHNAPIGIRRARNHHRLFSLKAECAPVGALEESFFGSATFQLEIGDTLVFYTDGVTESENSEGEAFGHKRLQRVLYDYPTNDPHRILEVILNELETHSVGRPQTDDITIVVMQVDAP